MKLTWQNKALKQIEKMKNKADKARIVICTRDLAAFPKCKGVLALTNHTYDYRLRVGNYRVLFNVNHEDKQITIEEVRKRDEHTY